MKKKCDECPDQAWCEKMKRCIRRDVPHYEDEQAMREYGAGLRKILARQPGTGSDDDAT